MFIQTELTPNPSTLKFLPGRTVMPEGTANFTALDQAISSPLASRLFAVDGVCGVFLGSDFVSVTKDSAPEWDVMKPIILAAIMDHFTSGDAIIVEGATIGGHDGSDDDEIVSQIKELLETRVRPAVAQDGGDIIFRSFEDGIVYLHMQGACSGCPSSTATLRNGIENMLRYYVPEVVEVRPAD
ncbi:MAG: NifU family protein [Rhodospirillales bacterium]|nr:NifU family protein [Rhodospirillales bacterium]